MVEALLRDLGCEVSEEVGEEQTVLHNRVDAGRGAPRRPRSHRRRAAVAPAAVTRRGVFVEADAFAHINSDALEGAHRHADAAPVARADGGTLSQADARQPALRDGRAHQNADADEGADDVDVDDSDTHGGAGAQADRRADNLEGADGHAHERAHAGADGVSRADGRTEAPPDARAAT